MPHRSNPSAESNSALLEFAPEVPVASRVAEEVDALTSSFALEHEDASTPTEQDLPVVGDAWARAKSLSPVKAYLRPLAIAVLAVAAVERVTMWKGEPSSPAITAPAAPSAAVVVDADAIDRASIDRVLDTYRQSHDSQNMSFDRCDVTVEDDRARASCTGVLDYVPKIEQAHPLQKRVLWNFDLQRADDRWLIAEVDAR